MHLIHPATDPWRPALPELGADHPAQPGQHVLLTPEQWRSVRHAWPASVHTGVALPNSADVEVLADDLGSLSLVAIHFPKWTDGRAYTQARLLRQRYRFDRQIRATGDVVVDMLPLLQRCGVDAAELRADQPLHAARQVLGFFDAHYQGDVRHPWPLFHRKAA